MEESRDADAETGAKGSREGWKKEQVERKKRRRKKRREEEPAVNQEGDD